jgi:hypothetical protein
MPTTVKDVLSHTEVESIDGFHIIKDAVAKRFASMQQQHKLYRTSVEKDALWDTYLKSFPPGANPIFRNRTEHDCSCCRQFIKSVGNVVAIIDGDVVSIWDVELRGQTIWRPVVAAMSALVKSKPIENVFRHYEPSVGIDKNYEDVSGHTGITTCTWHHFYSKILPEFVASKAEIPTKLGEFRSFYDVALRGLKTISLGDVDTVLDLIAQNSLYRGEEHKGVLIAFRNAKLMFDVLPEDRESLFVWENMSVGALRLRNTVIGTLLVDLSEGVELETAVKSFEQKVAPANYKRPSALITKRMIEDAKATIESLGLASALQRRYATLDDISINNVLFADRSLRKKLGGENVFDELLQAAGSTRTGKLDKVEEIPIAKFISDVLPNISHMEVLFENRHQGNLVSLIAPVDPSAGRLFKWDNRFSWSYQGEMADSVKERVKRAGGNVTGDLCCRLAWYNFDDLDLHMHEPLGYQIYYANRSRISPLGGSLDVDMNAGVGTTREPVENIFYASRNRMQDGVYKLFVHNFQARENINPGFEVEIDWMGTTHNFNYAKSVRDREVIKVALLSYSRANGLQVLPQDVPSTQATRQLWNLGTNQYHKVQAMMLSPNHWDGQGVGNRHWMFLLDGCKNDGTARGFFNEFLTEDLTKHRKVFEVVGGKTKLEESENQLSGLGFSSTKNDSLVCKVQGSFTRELKIVF